MQVHKDNGGLHQVGRSGWILKLLRASHQGLTDTLDARWRLGIKVDPMVSDLEGGGASYREESGAG